MKHVLSRVNVERFVFEPKAVFQVRQLLSDSYQSDQFGDVQLTWCPFVACTTRCACSTSLNPLVTTQGGRG